MSKDIFYNIVLPFAVLVAVIVGAIFLFGWLSRLDDEAEVRMKAEFKECLANTNNNFDWCWKTMRE